MLTNCATQLVFGRIYKFYNTKWVSLPLFPRHLSLTYPGVTHLHWNLRTRLSPLRSCSEFRILHRRPFYCWAWICWHLLWGPDDYISHSPSPQTAHILWTLRRNLRNRFRHWPSARRCLHRQSDLEMVLLHQPSHRRNFFHHHPALSQAPSTKRRKPHTPPTTRSTRSNRHHLLPALHH